LSPPIALRSGERRIEIDVHRRAVSPSGGLSEEVLTIRLDRVELDALAPEARPRAFARSRTATSQRHTTTWQHRRHVAGAGVRCRPPVVTRRGDAQGEDIGAR
jgi:hypothetical protein